MNGRRERTRRFEDKWKDFILGRIEDHLTVYLEDHEHQEVEDRRARLELQLRAILPEEAHGLLTEYADVQTELATMEIEQIFRTGMSDGTRVLELVRG